MATKATKAAAPRNSSAPRRICIYGAGAVGTAIGTWLSRAGHRVTLIARGTHLDALRRNGAVVKVDGAEYPAAPDCVATPGEAGPQDIVFITAKAPALPTIVESLEPLLGPTTDVVTVMNGLPWWLFSETDAGGATRPVADCLDPDGRLSRSLPAHRLLGCMISIGVTMVRPGVIEQSRSHLLELGEADGAESLRLATLVALLGDAGLNARRSGDIRKSHWQKLIGNASFGPISVLTGATNGQIGEDEEIRRLCRTLMAEILDVGLAMGTTDAVDLDERIRIGARLTDHRSSMLQDFLARRPMEIDSIVTPVVQLADRTGVSAPAMRTAWALLRQRVEIAYAGAA